MPKSNEIVDVVREKYGAVANGGLSSADAQVRGVAEAFGYTSGELASIPAEANMGLSCGNPTAYANLKTGEVVVDLGCGGGLDVFLAAQKVGPNGKAIGIDMTPEMIALARRNATNGPGGKPIENVEFYLAAIDKMPLPDAFADVIVSNCVINLAPDKTAVFREMHRVLKSGGRVAVSDIALKKPLPPEMAEDIMAYVGCIAGAMLIGDYRKALADGGFADVIVTDSGADLNAYAKIDNQGGCCSPAMSDTPKPATRLTIADASGACCSPPAGSTVHEGLTDLLARYDINEYAASVKVFALKSGASR